MTQAPLLDRIVPFRGRVPTAVLTKCIRKQSTTRPRSSMTATLTQSIFPIWSCQCAASAGNSCFPQTPMTAFTPCCGSRQAYSLLKTSERNARGFGSPSKNSPSISGCRRKQLPAGRPAASSSHGHWTTCFESSSNPKKPGNCSAKGSAYWRDKRADVRVEQRCFPAQDDALMRQILFYVPFVNVPVYG
jgi:hypothetical protein